MLYGRLDARRKETAEPPRPGAAQRDHRAPRRPCPSATPRPRCTPSSSRRSPRSRRACASGASTWSPDAILPPGSADAADPETPGFDQEVAYIGRLGLLDEDHDYEPLLIDWRAPVARPYYTATAANPDGIRRRRHLRTRSRRVLAVDDEILDLAEAAAAAARHDGSQRGGLTGEATLLAALTSGRTGRMGDIVATIQSEQDRIIRSGVNGVLVVEGGPGTGKTAVALHRAAYLLYTHRRQLAKRGVLVVGPTRRSCATSSRCCPRSARPASCSRRSASSTRASRRAAPSPPRRRRARGRPTWPRCSPPRSATARSCRGARCTLMVDGETVEIDRDLVAQARTRARRTRRPHNDAKRTFVREAIDMLARRERDRVSREGSHPEVAEDDQRLLDRGDLADIRSAMRENDDLLAALDELWPTLTPPQLLADLYTDPKRITAATRGWTDADRALLRRDAPPATGAEGGLLDPHWWTPADAVLLDEAAELLGEDDTAERERAERKREADEAYAAGVLEILAMEEDWDPEVLRPTDVVDASVLADRTRESNYASAAERAAEDRTWTFGHVIVDEAQELSPMAWRVLMRRCPSRSMTLVGDVAQTGARDGAGSWHEVLSPYVAARWRREALTVNYRTPAEIAEIAADVLAVIDPAQTPPESVRESGIAPRAVERRRVRARPPGRDDHPGRGRRRRRRRGQRPGRGDRPGIAGRGAARAADRRRADRRRPGRRWGGRRPGRRRRARCDGSRGGGGGLHRGRGQGAGVRRGRARRPGGDRRGVAARAERSLRRAHPGHPVARRGASGAPADGARPPRRRGDRVAGAHDQAHGFVTVRVRDPTSSLTGSEPRHRVASSADTTPVAGGESIRDLRRRPGARGWPVSTTDAGPPTVVGGRYTVGDLIGRGGAADVYRARDELLGRDVAIKMFGAGGEVVAAANAEAAAAADDPSPEVADAPAEPDAAPGYPDEGDDQAHDEAPAAVDEHVARYGPGGTDGPPRPSGPPAELVGDLEEGSDARNRREVLTLAALSHPGLVTVYDVGDDHGRAYFVMQLIEGDTLAQRIRRGPLPLGDVIALGAALADALGYVHRRGVVHRDVKPGNVLLDGDGRAHLSDFGIAAVRDAAPVTAAGMVIGTASYLSPEQVRGEAVTPAVDIYALGLVLIECLTGRREYPGNALEAAVARLHRRPVVPLGLPESLRSLLIAMTADDPAARPDADEVLAATRAVSRDVGLDAETVLSPALMAAPTGAFAPGPALAQGPASPAGSSATTGAYVETPAAGGTPPGRRRRGLLIAAGVALAAVLVAGSALAYTLVRGVSATAPLPPPASSVPAIPAPPAAVAPSTDQAEPVQSTRVRATTRTRARTTTTVAPSAVPTAAPPVVTTTPAAAGPPPVVVTTTPETSERSATSTASSAPAGPQQQVVAAGP